MSAVGVHDRSALSLTYKHNGLFLDVGDRTPATSSSVSPQPIPTNPHINRAARLAATTTRKRPTCSD